MKVTLVSIMLFLAATFQAAAAHQVFIDWDNDDTVADLAAPSDTLVPEDIYVEDIVMPAYVYTMPLVFTHMQQLDTVSPLQARFGEQPELEWIDKEIYKINNIKKMRQSIFANYPQSVRYNIATLPEPPKQYVAVADPSKAILIVEEVETSLNPEAHEISAPVKRIHWLNNFDGNVQFSQAYNSPNWYQGGNSHLNLLLNANYNLKLNQTYHPNLLFELNVQYKLAINSTPDDSIRKYNISEELFQINSKFGVKAAKHWFYTLTLMAKTQFLNNFPTNSHNISASFLSPGELNVGLGMTYSYTNPKKTVNLSASISPLSYNLRTCINPHINPTQYDIELGRKAKSHIGSSAEVNFEWKIYYNIAYKTRLFFFTDYKQIQGDWENTITFNINKYLSTMLFVHLRYDSSTPQMEGTRWHRWQLREILSFGFNYTFATI